MLASFQQINASEFEVPCSGSIHPSQVEHNYLYLVVTCIRLCFLKKPSGQIEIGSEAPLTCNKNEFQSRRWELVFSGVTEGFQALLLLRMCLMFAPAFVKVRRKAAPL